MMAFSMSYLNEIKSSFRNKRDVYEEFLQMMLDFKAEKISWARLIAKLRKLFQGHEALILGFNTFLPQEYQIVLSEDDETALSFVKKVEKAFSDDHGAFMAFISVLDMHSKGLKSIIEVYQEVSLLFRGHHHLLLEFRNYLPDTSVRSSISPPFDTVHAKKKQRIEDKSADKGVYDIERAFLDRVKATLRNSDGYPQLMKCMELYSKEIITRLELRELVHDLVGDYPELVKGFDEFLERVERTRKSVDMCSGKSIKDSKEELDLSRCEQVTPSYRPLPKDFVDTERNLNEQVKNCVETKYLNKQFKCVCSSDRPFRHRHKNRYEEKLFECEDEMFEMDMLMRPINETVERAEELLEKINKDITAGKKSVFCLDDYFTDRNLRCIKQLYNDGGTEILDSLKDNTTVVLSIILQKLKLKQKESAQHRKGVAKVIAENHKKLLGLHKRLCRKDGRDMMNGRNEEPKQM